MTEIALACDKCGKECSVRISGRCMTRNPFMVCPKCKNGTYVSSPIPSWQNRHVCDNCSHRISK